MSKPSLSITARPAEGFRRAGFVFSADKQTVIPLEDLTKDQIKQLKEEPQLVVVETDGAAAGKTAAAANAAELEQKIAAHEETIKAQAEDIEGFKAKVAELETALEAAKAPAPPPAEPDAEAGAGKKPGKK